VGKRLGVGLLKGLLVGAAIGAGIMYGLRWPTPSGDVLAYLLALGVGGTTGIFAGKAPWKEGAWIEAVLKGLVGVASAWALYWLASSYAAVSIPWPGAAAMPWTAIPPLYLAVVAGVYGALVELDHDDQAHEKPAKTRPAAKARVAVDEPTEAAAETKAARKRI
jgi:hypothetical protein